MTKLNGTSGQLFSVIAESINARSTARSGKGSGAQAAADRSFRDLLHKVASPAKQATSNQEHEAPVKPGALRQRVEQLTQHDGHRDETVHEHPKATEEPDASRQAASHDPATTVADNQSRLILPAVVEQALAAIPVLKPAAQSAGGDKDVTPARTERASAARERPITSAASAAKADIAESGSRPSAALPQTSMVGQDSATAPKSTPAAPGFEAVAANVERAAKVSARDTLPEATKVTVVQQETHFPPAPQFSAGQQIANAVVTELESSTASPAPAAPELASPQSNSPDQPLKILTISLDPPALGNVTVRLRLVGAAVSVHMAADRRDTSQMLDQQRDSIRELMQSAGYVADVAPVQHGGLDGFQAQPHQSFSGHQPSPQAQATLDGSSASSGQSQGGAKHARQDQQPNQETRHDQDVAPHHRRGAVYL